MHNAEHKRLVKGLIDYFDSRGFKIISADYENFEKCQLIGSHEPDVIAYHMDDDVYNIGEAKTCDDLDSEKTREQFEDFGNTVLNKIGLERKFLPFCIAVPKECMKKLEMKIEECGLSQNGNIQPLGF
jgi:hypothetical protein